MKKSVLFLIFVLALVCLWGLMSSDTVSITVNGQELDGPMAALSGAWGIVVAAVALFCVAILLAFVFAGVGLVILGSLAFFGIAFVAVAFPFLLPLLIPLFIVWAFCAGMNRGRRNRS